MTYFVNRSLIEEMSQSPHLDLLIWKGKVDLSHWQCCISHNYEELIRFTGRVKIKIFTVSISLSSFLTVICLYFNFNNLYVRDRN